MKNTLLSQERPRWMVLILVGVLFGVLVGSTLTAWLIRGRTVSTVVEDRGDRVSIVDVIGIRNGALVGTLSGSVLLMADGKAVDIHEDGSFAIRDSSVLTNVVSITVPPGMKFVASKRGKKYYPLESPDAQRIVPENRIYFTDAVSAQNAGYTK